ncbi:sortase-associated OmpA-like protein PdsO [Alteromonas sp. CYL-A6]|uniref:sortase-associated OmpA-like protein PdsO n=1 Tax=Alteromonas nitratireducens TaxID=3390813 RepID=UPI0034ADDDBC
MKKTVLAVAMGTMLTLPAMAQTTADEQKTQAIGLGAGALVGTVIGGPVGGVIGAIMGGMIGNDTVQDDRLLAAQQALNSAEDELFAMRDTLHTMQEEARLTRVSYQETPKEKVLAVQSSVQFKTASVNVEPAYHEQLDLVADALKRHPSLQVRLTGHADNRGDETFNEALSMQRALNVKQYLTRQGVDAGQILTVAVGEKGSKGQSYEDTFFDRKVVLEVADTGEVLTARR